MPILTMFQEIHVKLLTRIRTIRDRIQNSDMLICPRIRRELDLLVTESRNWTASWDGNTRFQVKQGTRLVTVDLDKRNCDCRVFDLTGIPCQHAIAALHSRRQNPIDFVSDYYKRDKYLATYSYPLEALKGEEYWDFYDAEELLPPPIPKKLRGRPKKMRRREEWEGGSRSQAQPAPGVILQRFSNKRVMHCSRCRQAGHRVSKCPKENATEAEEKTKHAKKKMDAGVPKKTKPRELKRQKLSIRRPQKGIDINEPTEEQPKVLTQASEAGSSKEKGKGKMLDTDHIEEEEEDAEMNTQEYAEKEFADDEDVEGQEEDVEDEGREEEGEEEKGKGAMSFLKMVPRKKMPFVRGEEVDEWDKSGKDYVDFSDKLRGAVGYKAVFMPTPGLLPFAPPRYTPPASTPPDVPQKQKQAKVPSMLSTSSGVTRRNTRLSSQKNKLNKFKNTSDDPIDL